MKVYLHKEPFHFLIIDDVYEEDELKLIWTELEYLYAIRDFSLLTPSDTRSATDNSGSYLKNNLGNFLQDIYKDDKYSPIMTLNQKILHKNVLCHPDSWFFNNLEYNAVGTLISYYDNGGYYQPHSDNALLTACTWFWKEPKQFTGGNFKFSEYGIQLEIQNNCAVVFPSHITHEVESVSMEQHANKGYGRYCMTQFIERIRYS